MQGVLKLFLKMLKILTNKLELRFRIEIFFNFGTESGARPGLELNLDVIDTKLHTWFKTGNSNFMASQ